MSKTNETGDRIRWTSCNECGRPWGLFLDSDTTETAAAAELTELWADYFNDYDEADRLAMPKPTLTTVFYVSEGNWRFIEQVNGECMAEPGFFYDSQFRSDMDIPAWMRLPESSALRVDCCEATTKERYDDSK